MALVVLAVFVPTMALPQRTPQRLPFSMSPAQSQPQQARWYTAGIGFVCALQKHLRDWGASSVSALVNLWNRKNSNACNVILTTTEGTPVPLRNGEKCRVGIGAFQISQSLNADPYNLRSEEIAVAECARGVEVRRSWTEQEMLRTFGGQMIPGTPDGVFESWDGTLTCVQVVRVPVKPCMCEIQLQEILQQTVLVKVVKSQQWLRVSHVVPHDFVIFCWLPFAVPDDVANAIYELMERIQKLDPRFSLRLRLPAEPGELFPSKFATHNCAETRKSERRDKTESDVATYNGSETDNDSDEDYCFSWDLTWDWEDGPGFSRAEEEYVEVPEDEIVEVELVINTATILNTGSETVQAFDTTSNAPAPEKSAIKNPLVESRMSDYVFDSGD